MTTAEDEQTTTVQNAAPAGDPPEGHADGGEAATTEDTPTAPPAKKTAARKRAAKKSAAADESDLSLPAGLSADGHTGSSGGEAKNVAIVHLFEFENGYGAKVFQRARGDEWTWAPTKDGNVIRHLPGLGRVPAQTSIANINAGLAHVAALK